MAQKPDGGDASPLRSDIGKYRKLSGQARTHARPHTPAGEWRPYPAAALAAFLAFDQTVRQHLGDRRTSSQRSFQVRRKAAGRLCELAQLPQQRPAWVPFYASTHGLMNKSLERTG